MQHLFYSIRLVNSRQAKLLLGVNLRQAQRVMCKVRDSFQKKNGQPVTMGEFCAYTGIDIDIACIKIGWIYPSFSTTNLSNCQS